MKLGTFSVSLSVKDIHQSKAFYEKLGFEAFSGNIEQNWLIMKNENTVIGLFQGMFEGNLMTFNPGWDGNAQEVNPFTDVRELEANLKANEVPFVLETDPSVKEGPASFMITDPDGNVILVDQHR